jgi:hypothetical protein
MNKKTVIGLIGDKEGRDIVADLLSTKGFYRVSIDDNVKSISNLLNIKNDLNSIRERGYKVSRLYWINLVLSLIPDDKKLVVIDDARLEDIVEKVIKAYYIGEKEHEMPKYVEKIEKGSDIGTFRKIVNKKFDL